MFCVQTGAQEKSKMTDAIGITWVCCRISKPGDEILQNRLHELVLNELANCPECYSTYVKTGWIPVYCDLCKADRDTTWMVTLENLARRLTS